MNELINKDISDSIVNSQDESVELKKLKENKMFDAILQVLGFRAETNYFQINRIICFRFPRSYSVGRQLALIFLLISFTMVAIMYSVLIVVIFSYRSKVLYLMHS